MAKNILANPDATYMEAPIAAALKPGSLVKFDNNGEFVATVANDGGGAGMVMVLDMDPMGGGGIETAYTVPASGDKNTARAERLISGKGYQVRTTAGTFSLGEAIKAGAGAAQETSGNTNPVIGYALEAKTTTSSDPFLYIVAA